MSDAAARWSSLRATRSQSGRNAGALVQELRRKRMGGDGEGAVVLPRAHVVVERPLEVRERLVEVAQLADRQLRAAESEQQLRQVVVDRIARLRARRTLEDRGGVLVGEAGERA